MMSARDIFTNSKVYELPIAKTYVRHWGMVEAVRELLQNALDSESPFEYEFAGDKLSIRSRHATLAVSTLLLGQTSKAERTDSIGSFGEGYKIALLVLARMGYPVIVHNGDRTWTPVFRHSRQFEAEVLCIEDTAAARRREGVTFEIGGLTPADEAAIRESCLHMQGNVGELMEVSQGRILRERPGKLYVGGLFVCGTKLKFGYDMKPEFLRLERDRQTVSSFDLQWLTKNMWFETERYDEIAAMVDAGVADLEYAEHGAPELVREACYRIFAAKHPGKVVAKSQDDLQQMVRGGLVEREIVVVRDSMAKIVRSARSYQVAARVAPPLVQPAEHLKRWLRANRGEMRSKAIEAFKALVEQADGWVIGDRPKAATTDEELPF